MPPYIPPAPKPVTKPKGGSKGGSGGSGGSGGGGGGTPKAPAKPKIPATFAPNWQRRISALKQVGYSPKQINTVINFDFQRANQGLKPFTDAQAYAAAHVIRHHKDLFNPKTGAFTGGFSSGGLLGNLSSDFTNFVESLPTLAQTIVKTAHRATAASDVNSRVDTALETPNVKQAPILSKELVKQSQVVQSKWKKGDIGGAIQEATNTPALQLFPGSHTAGILAGQGPGGVLKEAYAHPLNTALDVLPAAMVAGKLATEGRLAEAGSAAEAFQEGNVPKGLFRASLGTVEEPKSLAGEKLLSSGTVTKLPRSSELVRAFAEDQGWDKNMREVVYRQFETDRRALATHMNNVAGPYLEIFGQDPATSTAVRDVLEAKAPLSSLPAHLQPLVTEYQRIDQIATARGVASGDLRQLQDPRTGELHTYAAKDPVMKAYDRLGDAQTKVRNYAADETVPPRSAAKAVSDLETAQAKFRKAFLSKPPRAFYPLMYQHATADLQALWEVQKTNGELSPATYASYMEELGRGSIPAASKEVYTSIIKDHAKYWYSEYSGGGKRPVYVPNASESQLKAMTSYAPFADHVHGETIYKRAALNQFRPGVADLALQLTYRDMQTYLHDITQEHVNVIGDTFARTPDQARAFEATTIGKVRIGPGSSLDAKIDAAVNKNWVPWKESVGKLPGAASKFAGEEDRLIPRSVANSIDRRLKQYETPKSFASVWDKSTKTFRIAVTTSPRHVVHVTTAGLMYQALDDPSALFKAPAAWRMVSSGEFENIPELGSGVHFSAGMASDDLRSHFDGLVMGEMTKAHLQNIPVVGRGVGGVFGKAAAAVDWLHSFEGHIAAMWKAGSYLQELDKQGALGVSGRDAELAAIQYANKIHMDADTMTPFERTITRAVAPFYAFTRQLLRYLFRYPGDHPIAASVIARAGQMELQDQSTGLPNMFRTFVKVPGPLRGATDFLAGGQGSYIDIKTLNPFRNLGEGRDPWTIQGLISSLNPAYRAPLEYLGINTLSANVSQYLGQHVDPQTGSLVTNPAMSGWDAILHNYLPQSSIPIISNLLQSQTYLDQLSQTDPTVYRHTLSSILGIPFMPFDPQINRAYIKQQINYMTVAQKAVSSAIKSGDLSSLDQYPEVPYKGNVYTPDQLRKLLGAK